MKRLRCRLQPHRAGKKNNRVSSEIIILLPNVQIFTNNCCGPADPEECFILLFWPGFWQRASLKSVHHSAVHSSLIPTSPLYQAAAAPWRALGLLLCFAGGWGRQVKGTHKILHLLFLQWCSPVFACYSQKNVMDAQVYIQMRGVPQVNPAVAGDHHKLHRLDLKGTLMKLIETFK